MGQAANFKNVCPYNPGSYCDAPACYKCGWNPEVAECRLENDLKEEKDELD